MTNAMNPVKIQNHYSNTDILTTGSYILKDGDK